MKRAFVALLLCGCPAPVDEDDAGSSPRDAGRSVVFDAGKQFDAGPTGDSGALTDAGDDAGDDAGVTVTDAGELDVGGARDAGTAERSGIVVVTFNTGTGTTAGIDDDGDAWTSVEQGIGDEHYGNGLAWREAIEGTRAFFDALRPDIVAFQEVFDPSECASIPSNVHAGFICDGYSAGDPTVAESVLGDGYEVACHPGKPDKCVGVRRAFGSLRGGALDGAEVPGCGSGSRIGRGVIDLPGGGEITVVSVHGNSGASDDDINCREAQADQVFVDFDGAPAANGARNIVLGDLNTDPGRAVLVDNSADRWEDYVNDDTPFHFVTDIGFLATPTYAGVANIDHVISDVFDGECTAAGITDGAAPVLTTAHFDHTAIVCVVE